MNIIKKIRDLRWRFSITVLIYTILAIPAYRFLDIAKSLLFFIFSLIFILYFLQKIHCQKKTIITCAVFWISVSMAILSDSVFESTFPSGRYLVQLLIIFVFAWIAFQYLRQTENGYDIRSTQLSAGFCSIIIFGIGIAGLSNHFLATKLYREAVNFSKAGDSLNAIAKFHRTLDVKPTMYETYAQLCAILYRNGQYDEVLKVAKKGLRYPSMTSPTYETVLFEAANSSLRRGQFTESQIYFDKMMTSMSHETLCEHFGGEPEFNFYRGYFHSLRKEWKEALPAYREALRINPHNPFGVFKTAEALYFLERDDEALILFEKLSNTGFSDPLLYLYRAEIYERFLNYAEAIAMYKRYVLSIQNYSNYYELFANGYTKIGQLYEKLNNWEKAEKTYKKIILISPLKSKGHILLGEFYVRRSQYSDAIREFSQLLKDTKSSAEGNCLLAEVYAKIGTYDLADQYFRRAIKMSYFTKKDIYVRAIKGMALLSISRNSLTDTIKWYKKLEKLYPEFTYFAIAKMYLEKNLFDQAFEISEIGYRITKMREQSPYLLIDLYKILIKHYKEKGDNDKVIAISKKLLSFEPIFFGDRENITLALAQAYYNREQYGEALRIAEEILSSDPGNQIAKNIISRKIQTDKSVHNYN